MAAAKWSFLFLLGFSLLGNAAWLMVRILGRPSQTISAEMSQIFIPAIRLAGIAAVCVLLWILVVPPGRLFGQTWLLLLFSAVSILYLIEASRILLRSIRVRSNRARPVFANLLRTFAIFSALVIGASLFHWVPFAWRGSNLMMDRFSRDLKRAGVWLQSTLVLYETGMGIREGYRYEQRVQDPAFRYLTQPLQEQWKGIAQMLPSWMVRVWGRHPEFTRKLTASLHRAGVPIMAGTDALGAPFIIPGASLHQELQLLRESGLSPHEVLWTATLGPAKFLGKETEFGTITAGKRADLILIEGNPLRDLGLLRGPRGVMVRGIWLPKEKLSEMLVGMVSQKPAVD